MTTVNVPQAMRGYASFIVWKLIQQPGKPKPDKIPFNPMTGQLASTTNPADWATYDVAVGAMYMGGYHGIGFVFSASDPFFFLDIDGARVIGADGVANWAGYALDIVNRFPGAAIEVSQSGSGLHIVGYCRKPDLASRRSVWRDANAGKLEFYTAGRFMAVGGGFSSEPISDLTAACLALVPEREAAGDAEGYAGPRSAYTGPTDDDALIALMLAAGGSKAAKTFGGGAATIAQLWQGDSAALSAFFPDSAGSGRAFDHSAADAALLQHLAFWTGADGERMERLFARSALGNRDKWRDRQDYRYRSVMGAVRGCQRIYDVIPTEQKTKRDKPKIETGPVIGSDPVPVAGGGPSDPFAEAAKGEALPSFAGLLTSTQQAQLFKGCVSIVGLGRILTPSSQLLDATRFNIAYGGSVFILDENAKTTDEPWKAATRGTLFKLPVYDDLCFRPDLPPREVVVDDLGRKVINSYVPVKVERSNGDASPFLKHIKLMLPDERDRDLMLSYAAACVQYPGVKFQWCPIIQGIKGNGKTLITRAVSYAIGERYVHSVNPEELGAGGTKFNSWLFQKLLIVIEEIYVRGNYAIIESLKPLITNDRIEFQAKGQDQFTGDNRANFIMATNHKDAVPIDEDERRYAMFYTAQQTPEDMVRDGFIDSHGVATEYMADLYDWFNGTHAYAKKTPGKHHVAGWLARYKIPDAMNPARALHRAPRTSSWSEVRLRSASPAEETINDAVADGLAGFRNGWVSGWALEKLFNEKRMRISRRVYRDILARVGYLPHPSLLDGRSTVPILQEDARKPRLYILKGHPSLKSPQPSEDYMISQGYR